MKRTYLVAVCLALLAISLALRLPGLASFLTPDEGDWGKNTARFTFALIEHRWADTLTFPYPGVTTTWAGAAGLALKWLFARPDSVQHLTDLTQLLADVPNRLDFLPWLRLPVVLASALGIVLIYLLARRLLGEGVALVGALLLAFDPFFLAHSRLIQTDALLTISVTVAWLCLLLASTTRRRSLYALAGVALAAAALTKSPAVAIFPLATAWVIWQHRVVRLRNGAPLGSWRVVAGDLLWLSVPALAAFWLAWPALWVAPITTLGRVWGLMWAFGTGGHELGSYWLGQPVADAGPAFYGAVLLWRTTPVTLIGLLLAAWAWEAGRRRGASAPIWSSVGGLWLLVLWFTLIISLSDKKFDRYLLPAFPAIDLLAAWGWTTVGSRFYERLRHRGSAAPGGLLVASSGAMPGVPAGASAARAATGTWPVAARGPRAVAIAAAAPAVAAGMMLVASQAWQALAARPYYLPAYNVLAGGMAAAQRVMLVGWGEGLPEAAAYLNAQGSQGSHAATWYGQNVFQRFYDGYSYDLYYDARRPDDLYARDVDYVVTYVNQEQRRLVDPAVIAQLGQPLYTSRWGDLPLARVYRWPKPFAHTTDRDVGPGLRLLGWDLGSYDPVRSELSVRLYWDASRLADRTDPSQPIVLWLKDETGEVWARVEQSPAPAASRPARDWLASTGSPALSSDWLERQAVEQHLSLRLPLGLRAGSYRVEMAPAGNSSLALGDVPMAATHLAGLPDPRSVPDPWTSLATRVTFGASPRLVGFRLDRQGAALQIDLLWAPLAVVSQDAHYFIHVVGEDDRIVVQADGPLGQPASSSAPAWAPGELVRQRVRLELPGSARSDPYRVFVGLYRPDDGQRLPLFVKDEPVADGRYLLTTVPAP